MSTCSDSFSSSRAKSSASISICSPSSRALGRDERSISDPSYHALVGCDQLIYTDHSLWLLRASPAIRELSLAPGEPGKAVMLRSMGANVHSIHLHLVLAQSLCCSIFGLICPCQFFRYRRANNDVYSSRAFQNASGVFRSWSEIHLYHLQYSIYLSYRLLE